MASNKDRKKKRPLPIVAATPEVRPGFRDPDYVQPVLLRMGTGHVDALDDLCQYNRRSRRELVELLIENAAHELHHEDKPIMPKVAR